MPVVFPVHPRTAKNLRELDSKTPQLNYVKPLLHMADVLAFSPYMDALLLVVEEGNTPAEEVQRALSLVKNSRPVLGTVLNKAGQMVATLASMRTLLSH